MVAASFSRLGDEHMNTNLKSFFTVAAICGAIAAFAYPVVIVSHAV